MSSRKLLKNDSTLLAWFDQQVALVLSKIEPRKVKTIINVGDKPSKPAVHRQKPAVPMFLRRQK